jgi:UDP-N-acetylmuramoyl-L-alanyl-D-glutamate--2,6-diaminopimelate ligase
MKLKQLVQGISDLKIKGSKEIEITGLSADSKTVAPGNLFIAKRGSEKDGSEFILEASQAGAAAILAPFYNPFLKQTQIIHEKPECLESQLAARYYQNPSKELWIAGVTGTKGKTTTTYLIRHLLERMGKRAGLMGGVETIAGAKRFPSKLTTHDAIRNQKMLRDMISEGCVAAVMEVSSHGLEQGRVDEIDFDLALFTNLYPDHLDYHKTMDEYAAAKRKLFGKARARIFNADSPWFEFMSRGVEGLTYGIEKTAEIRASEIELGPHGTSLTVEYRGKKQRFSTPLIGRFNIYNLLAAISVGLHQKSDLSSLASIFSSLPIIPGRLEQVENDLGIRVFVDFAHSGEALENVLSSLREIASKRLIVVFGSGGGRDPARRSGMAAAAEKWADLAIVTTDNPRHEDPKEICREVLAAFQKPEKAILEIDRKNAIRLGVELARSGDILLIAGKGHEKTQIFNYSTIPFDDCLIAKEALQNRQSSAILS